MCAHEYIEENDLKQELFAQEKPHFVCQSRGRFRKISEQSGFPVKCPNPRCSKACLRNWVNREARTISHFLSEYLPIGHTIYRGNVKLLEDATPDEHVDVRASFLRAIQRRCPDLHVRAVMHITNMTNAHYDIVAYAPETYTPERIETAVKAAWKVAGGLGVRATCKPLDNASELDDPTTGWASYVVKASKSGKATGEDRNDRWRWIPLRLKDGGIKLTFGTKNFWGKGRTAESVHADWVAKTFPKQFRAVFQPDQWGDVETAPRTIGNNVSPTLIPSDTNSPQSAESAWHEIAGDHQEVKYQLGSLLEARLGEFLDAFPNRALVVPIRGTYEAPDPEVELMDDLHKSLPTSPEEAVTVAELTQRTGWWPMEQFESALKAVPGVKFNELLRDGRVNVVYREVIEPVRRPVAWLRQDLNREVRQSVEQPARETPELKPLTDEEQAEMEAMFAVLDGD